MYLLTQQILIVYFVPLLGIGDTLMNKKFLSGIYILGEGGWDNGLY